MLPILLEQARAMIGKRRLTVVFDRGGYSPKLFLRLITARFDILTALEARRARLPARIPALQAVAGKIVRLAPERQHLINVLKMVAEEKP